MTLLSVGGLDYGDYDNNVLGRLVCKIHGRVKSDEWMVEGMERIENLPMALHHHGDVLVGSHLFAIGWSAMIRLLEVAMIR